MKKLPFLFSIVLIFALLSSCGAPGSPANPGGTTSPAGTTPAAPTANPAGPTPTMAPSTAGGDFLAIAVDDLGGGWMRIRTAGNRDNCAWSNQFKLTLTGSVTAQVPHCWEIRATGTGTMTFTVKPDATGYTTSDTLNTGLAWWPAGNNGTYTVTRNGVVTASQIPLTTGPEGVTFPLNGGEVTITVTLNNGFLTMPLGEIMNNVQPKY